MTETLAVAVSESLQPQRQGSFEGGLLTDELVVQLEKQVELQKRARAALLKFTEPEHWMDIGGEPYLMDAGIHAIASPIGVEFTYPEVTTEMKTDAKGEYMTAKVTVTARWRGKVDQDLGFASSRDDLWKKLSIAECEGDVQKKSITNGKHRTLLKITGLGGVTWGMLERLGITRETRAAVRFKGSEGKMTTGTGAWTVIKQKIWGYLLEWAGGEPDRAAQTLAEWTENKTTGYKGVSDPQKLSDRQADWLIKEVEKAWQKQNPGVAPPAPAGERETGAEG